VFCRVDQFDDFHTEIYAADVATHAAHLIFKGPVQYQGQLISYLGWPILDSAGKTLYVIARQSVTTGLLFAVNLATSLERYITEAAEYEIVQSGPEKGRLLVSQRKNDGRLIRYEWWLYTTDGKPIKLVTRERLKAEDAARLVGGMP
jgi:hypothetical protein